MYALQIQNTNESDRRSYEAKKAVAKKAQNKKCFTSFITVRIAFTGILYPQVYTYGMCHIHISLCSYKGYKLNSLLTCFQQGFIAQLVEHCTGIAEVMGSNPVEASEFFLGILSARITFTHISFLLIHFVVFRL